MGDPATIIFPLVLFALTLIIVMSMRSKDRKNDSMSSARVLVQQCRDEMDRVTETFKRDAQVVCEEIDNKIAEAKAAIVSINGQIAKIQSFGNDMNRIKATLDSYRSVIAVLTKTKDETQERIDIQRRQIEQLTAVSDIIEQHKEAMIAADDRLADLERRILADEEASKERVSTEIQRAEAEISDRVAAVSQDAMNAIFGMRNDASAEIEEQMRQLNNTMQSVVATAREYFNEIDARIEAGHKVLDQLADVPEESPAVWTREEASPVVDIPEIVIRNADEIHEMADALEKDLTPEPADEQPAEEQPVEEPVIEEEAPVVEEVVVSEPEPQPEPGPAPEPEPVSAFEEPPFEEPPFVYDPLGEGDDDGIDIDDEEAQALADEEGFTSDEIGSEMEKIMEEEDENPYGEPDFGGDPDERMSVSDIAEEGPEIDINPDEEDEVEYFGDEEEIKLD